MPAQTLATEAIVLDRTASGDQWMRFTCFSAGHGNLDCLQRQSRRPGATTALDLFDHAQLSLETRNNGRTWFIKEAATVARHAGLGRSYDALRHACRFARILARNPVHEESRESVHALFVRALGAWENQPRPDAVYFKALYLFTRDEGYPVRESWWTRLDTADRDAVDAMLHEPAAGQTTAETTACRLIDALETFVRHETEIRIEE
ncbi:MAG: hypothetical protein ACREIA_02145 [Opitutaceae bacterium]